VSLVNLDLFARMTAY